MVKKSPRRSKRDVRRTKRYVRRSKRVMRGGMERFPHGRTVYTGDDADFQRILGICVNVRKTCK